MRNLPQFFRNHSILLFFILAFAISWWPAPFTKGQILPYGPALAGLLVTLMTTDKKGRQNWFKELRNWRQPWHWYGLGPVLALFYQGSAVLVMMLMGVIADAAPVVPSRAILLELLLLGGWWEEPGWTGFALPRLSQQFSRYQKGNFIAITILVIGRSLWHIPLALYENIPFNHLLIFIPAFQLMIAWLYTRSKGSLGVVCVFHLAANILGSIFNPMYSGRNQDIYSLVFGGIAAVTAILLYMLFPSRRKILPVEVKIE